jgi:uncharacterized membrane protein YidH (DUF202 family)
VIAAIRSLRYLDVTDLWSAIAVGLFIVGIGALAALVMSAQMP